ncbi:hypothetical protein [Parafrankia sp. CH37]|uniref:hypothetical protein n=1 Tax=Parafrankia sp. CH37 TaxID=683308 RepID=UPI001D01D43C|nr:hypothetical protein [Parafrankia sp. CH37]
MSPTSVEASPLPWQVVAEEQDGVITVAVALAGGMTRAELRWRVSSGRWQQPFAGVAITHSGPVTERQREWCALAVAGPGAALAGATAAAPDGLRGHASTVVHVLVPTHRPRVTRPGIAIRRAAHLGEQDVHPTRAPRRTRLPRSVVDMASWAARDDDARAVLASAVGQRLVTVEQLRPALEQRSTLRRRALIRDTLDDLADGAHSVAEIVYRRIERRYGLPAAQRQATVNLDGRRYLDVWYEPWRVWVEIDGAAHREPRQWWDDLARQNLGVLDDRLVLRFPTWLLRLDPEHVAAQVRLALHQRGWTPDPDETSPKI